MDQYIIDFHLLSFKYYCCFFKSATRIYYDNQHLRHIILCSRVAFLDSVFRLEKYQHRRTILLAVESCF